MKLSQTTHDSLPPEERIVLALEAGRVEAGQGLGRLARRVVVHLDELGLLFLLQHVPPGVDQVAPALREQIVARAKALGIDTQALIWVTHERTDPQP